MLDLNWAFIFSIVTNEYDKQSTTYFNYIKLLDDDIHKINGASLTYYAVRFLFDFAKRTQR